MFFTLIGIQWFNLSSGSLGKVNESLAEDSGLKTS